VVDIGELVLVAVLHSLFNSTMSQCYSLTRSLARDVPVTRDAAEACVRAGGASAINCGSVVLLE
jgi:hypothetical protein